MRVSVITISYNAVDIIERTIKSTIAQTSHNFEYIIVDGGSKDGTVNVIEKYDKHITKWISEPDKGIYNAMNKGVSMASGDYCIFMNAGDVFFSPNVIEQMLPSLDNETSIVMGNQIYVNDKGYSHYGKFWREVTLRNLFRGSLYHQASFILTKELINSPYDENLRMVSDWKMAHELLIQQNKKYKGVDVNVCMFYTDGVTNRCQDLKLKECQNVLDSMYPQRVQADHIADETNYKRWWNVPRYFIFLHRRAKQAYYRAKLKSYVQHEINKLNGKL